MAVLVANAGVLPVGVFAELGRLAGRSGDTAGDDPQVARPGGQLARSTMGHETSHVILNHEFDLLVTGEKTCVSKDEEDEADWLGAELLFPRAAARRAVLRSIPIEQVCQHYGVSFEIARWRTNICGAKKMLKRSRQ